MKKQFYQISLFLVLGIFLFSFSLSFSQTGTKEDVFVCGQSQVQDIDGNNYETAKFGNDCWMIENLKTTRYKNGLPIEKIEDHNKWWQDKEGSYALYDYTFPFRYIGREIKSAEEMLETYGYLYNFYAVANQNGLCPEGWKVPTDENWKQLEIHLGLNREQADQNWYRGTNEGSKISGNKSLWGDGKLKENKEFGASGFNALPAGYRRAYGDYGNIGSNANFWTSNEQNNYGVSREIYAGDSSIYRITNISKDNGHSVRCILNKEN